MQYIQIHAIHTDTFNTSNTYNTSNIHTNTHNTNNIQTNTSKYSQNSYNTINIHANTHNTNNIQTRYNQYIQNTYSTSNIHANHEMPYPKRSSTVGLTRPKCHEDALVFPGCWQSHKACTSHVIDRQGALGMCRKGTRCRLERDGGGWACPHCDTPWRGRQAQRSRC